MAENSMLDTVLSGVGILTLLYFMLWGVLQRVYGRTLVVRIWKQLGPGVLFMAFCGVMAGKLGDRNISDLVTKGLIPLCGFSVMIANLIVMARGLAQPIQKAVGFLSDGAGEVASASRQISAASDALAKGASEQAAAIEETSSSLEEMSATTRQNAENAKQADNLMKETNQCIEEARNAMQALNQSMGEISAASEQTSRIVKTIDEIAFQTNLLALNAAVEAARAGEAGAGFAVVADEVRNLAMRAAEAARNTAGLISETVAKVDAGARTVTQTAEVFNRVVTNSGKAVMLVDEIATASVEQAQGISQLNAAVGEMDKVVQQNAATAEEAAASTESIRSQADRMHQEVQRLAEMVFDRTRQGDGSSASVDGDDSFSFARQVRPANVRRPASLAAGSSSKMLTA